MSSPKPLQSESLVDQIVNKFVSPKKHQYSESTAQFYATSYNLNRKDYKPKNKYNQTLFTTLYFKETSSHGSESDPRQNSPQKSIDQQSPYPQTCIVYCHGFGSTRIQSMSILKVLPKELAICSFDFSGSGKSQGQMVTYGAKQHEDVDTILKLLRQIGFKKFILWGRSMGATSLLLYSVNYQPKDVILQISDSAFYSFEKVALEVAKRSIGVPQFGVNILLNMMRESCKRFKKFDPFNVSLDKISKCKIETLFIYNQNDQIVDCSNTQILCEKFREKFEKMIITAKHNSPRTSETLKQVIKKISIAITKHQNMTERSNRVAKEINCSVGKTIRDEIYCGNRQKSNRKAGIQRVSVSTNKSQRNSSLRNSGSDYGLFLLSKPQTPSALEIYGGKSQRSSYLKLNSAKSSISLAKPSSVQCGSQNHTKCQKPFLLQANKYSIYKDPLQINHTKNKSFAKNEYGYKQPSLRLQTAKSSRKLNVSISQNNLKSNSKTSTVQKNTERRQIQFPVPQTSTKQSASISSIQKTQKMNTNRSFAGNFFNTSKKQHVCHQVNDCTTATTSSLGMNSNRSSTMFNGSNLRVYGNQDILNLQIKKPLSSIAAPDSKSMASIKVKPVALSRQGYISNEYYY